MLPKFQCVQLFKTYRTLGEYLYARELKIWEDTSDWGGIRQIIHASRKSFKGVRANLRHETDGVTNRSVHLIMCLCDSIDPAMKVESGLNCSRPLTMQKDAPGCGEQRVDRAAAAPNGAGIERGFVGLPRCFTFVRACGRIDCADFNAVVQEAMPSSCTSQTLRTLTLRS